MNFQPHFLRIATLPIASLLLIIGAAALRPVCATELNPESDAERYVLEQVQKGEDANLKVEFPTISFRELRGSFIEALLTNRDSRGNIGPGVMIHIIIGSLFVPIGLAALTGIIK